MNESNFENRQIEITPFSESADLAVNQESGFAIVVIKPDALKKRDEILNRIESAGLHVVKSIIRELPNRFVAGVMYKDLPESIEEETLRHFNEGPSEIVLVRGGDDVLQKVIKLTGESTNPAECNKESIRYLFGEHFGRETKDDKTYYRNAVHRSKNPEEQADDLKKFRDLM